MYVDGSCRRCSGHPPTDRYRYGRCNAWSRPGRAVLTGRVTTSREHRPSVRCDCDVLQYAGRFVFYQTESRDIGPTLSRISRHETYNSRASMPVSGHCFCPNVVVCHRGCSQLYFSVIRLSDVREGLSVIRDNGQNRDKIFLEIPKFPFNTV